ncbi:MAG: aldo/keto reductase [Spirochaetaceae bacterium]
MTRYNLGRTDLTVSPVGLGCWQFSQGKGLVGRYWDTLPQRQVTAIVRASLEGGVNWFDTAEVYGKGASERSLAAALDDVGPAREEYLIADKWFPAFRFAGNIERSYPGRVENLGGRSVDLHQIHQPFSLSSVEQQARELGKLVTARRVRAVGVSNFNEKRMRLAAATLWEQGVPLATNQMRYSLIDREIERNGVLEAAEELGVTVIAYSPLAQGILTGKFHGEERIEAKSGPRKHLRRFKPEGLARTEDLLARLRRIAEGHGASPAQVALAWTVQFHGSRIVAIPGASSVTQARSNAKAMELTLSTDELYELAEAGSEAEKRLKG